MASISTDFDGQTNPFRRELLAHCYQMLGSVHDAEDLVQETMLRAWRARDKFDEQRGSLRVWLHHIATNACLTALVSRSKRPMPSGLGAPPNEDPNDPLVRAMEVPWLQPIPDAMVRGDGQDPAAVLLSRGKLRLAFVAAMQVLPARQRAILILRDVFEFSAAEVAEMLDTTVAAVNSGLQRARVRLDEFAGLAEFATEPDDPQRRAVLDRYVAAFERADVAEIKRLLTEDVVLEMPPVTNWFIGPDNYAGFMEFAFRLRGPHWRMVPVAANGQPAMAAYVRGEDGRLRLHTLQVFTVTKGGISHNAVFQDEDVFDIFGLQSTVDD
jgi:RNA polymerase sigma-70 factor (ECF subfamily)